MKKNISVVPPAGEAAVVTVQLQRMEEALGGDWMAQLRAAPETVRTWKKRGFVPLVQLDKAAELSGRPIEWFKVNQTGGKATPSFFPDKEKQVSRDAQRPHRSTLSDAAVLQRVISLVEVELDEMGLVLSPQKKAQLITLLYQRFVEQKGLAHGASELESVRQFLSLVA